MGVKRPHILVVGAGLSGLSACLEIERLNGRATLLEATSHVGGRVKTDSFKGFLLDRGFQVLLTSYPEIQRLDILDSLDLVPFSSGAIAHKQLCRFDVINPLRHFFSYISSKSSFSLRRLFDFFILAQLALTSKPSNPSTFELIESKPFSDHFKECFLKPFFQGISLDMDLKVRSSVCLEYLRLFLRGLATLPKNGMQALPYALYHKLKKTDVHFNKKVVGFKDKQVELANKEIIKGDAVIFALDNPSASQFIKTSSNYKSQLVTCFYFAVKKKLIKRCSFLHLGMEGPIVNLCIPNHIQPSYAPSGFDLISATVVDPHWQKRKDLQGRVRDNIGQWLNLDPFNLNFLKAYKIKHALPSQSSPPILTNQYKLKGFNKVFLSGELVETPSINGALLSGRVAACWAMESLGKS